LSEHLLSATASLKILS